MLLSYFLPVWFLFLCISHAQDYPNSNDNPDAFWYGTQDLDCLKGKGAMKVKRSASTGHLEAIERSTIQYVHRLLYFRGQVYEWGAGTRGYHFGPTASILECPLVWEQEPAGTSQCTTNTTVKFTRRYRVRYGGYNMVTNNCHHYVNRLGMMLSSETCEIGEDKWLRFNRRFGAFMRRFMAVFDPGSMEHPSGDSQEGNPHNVHDWPIVQWYSRKRK